MGYVLVDKNKKRIRKDGELTPFFPYAVQAEKYIDNYLGGSKYVDIHKVSEHKISSDKVSKNIIGVPQQGDKFKQLGNQHLNRWQQNMRNRILI